MKLTVNLKENSYPIYIENGILTKSGEYISRIFNGQKIMVISDDNVFPLYGQKITDSLTSAAGHNYECHSLVLPHGEPTKNFQSLPKIYEAMLEAKLTRSDLVIALGGGVIGDLAGFAAAITAGKLLGLTLEQLEHALGIVLPQASGTLQSNIDGALVKRMHPAFGVQGGKGLPPL